MLDVARTAAFFPMTHHIPFLDPVLGMLDMSSNDECRKIWSCGRCSFAQRSLYLAPMIDYFSHSPARNLQHSAILMALQSDDLLESQKFEL